jgi:penicillin-binding protein 2
MMMRGTLRKHIPSMFHRRLLLLALSALVMAVMLGAQTVRLSVGAEHERRRAAAERALQESHPIPTVRGRILDRYDRPLAVDEPGYEVAVKYSVISGEWAYLRAYDAAEALDRERWKELDPLDRRALIEEHLPFYEKQAQAMWELLAEISGSDPLELNRRKDAIRRQVQRVISSQTMRNRKKREKAYDEPVSWAEAREKVMEETWAHAVLSDIPDHTRRSIQGFIAGADEDPNLAAWREVVVRQPKQRRYPNETFSISVDRSTLPSTLRHDEPLEVTVRGVALHHLGQLRGIWASDEGLGTYSAKNPRGYMLGDQIGRWGIEKSMEQRLRGTRGLSTTQLDTGEKTTVWPTAGRDVRLTLDIQLQAQVQALMSPKIGLMTAQPYQKYEDKTNRQPGWQLNGAAVVMEIESGEVLAAVSMPEIPLQVLREESEKIFDDHVNQPYLNRVVSRPYQPGSTVKPILLASAVTAGKLSLGEQITCNGFLDPKNPDGLRCWIYKSFNQTHGPLYGREAIMHSCNIYFYTVGRRMGLKRLSQWYRNFGLGRVTGSGLPEEVAGDLPDPDKPAGEQDVADATFMGIGQGPIRWTPIQAANAYATLARGGVWTQPTFIKDEDRIESRTRVDLHLSPAAVREAMQGLDDVANSPLSSSHTLRLPEGREPLFNVQGVKLYAKTGTAQGVPHRVDADGDGRITRDDPIAKSGDHAWVIALLQPDSQSKPTHVVVVVVEYGGSGSQVAGPVVNQIIHVMQREGYLN